MNDIYYLILTICAVVATTSLIYLVYWMVDLIKAARRTIDRVDSTFSDVEAVKDVVKFGVLGIVSKIKRGVKNI
jgi:hypothetical protein